MVYILELPTSFLIEQQRTIHLYAEMHTLQSINEVQIANTKTGLPTLAYIRHLPFLLLFL